jgi:hypothetical protein
MGVVQSNVWITHFVHEEMTEHTNAQVQWNSKCNLLENAPNEEANKTKTTQALQAAAAITKVSTHWVPVSTKPIPDA